MSQFLSKSEIESLLSPTNPEMEVALKPNCDQANHADPTSHTSNADKSFWSPHSVAADCISRQSVVVLRRLQTTFPEQLNRRLERNFHGAVAFQFADLSLAPSAEMLSKSGLVDVHGWMATSEKCKHEVLICWQKSLAEFLLSEMLGGELGGAVASEPKLFNSMDSNGASLRLMSHLCGIVVDELGVAIGSQFVSEEVRLLRPGEFGSHLSNEGFRLNLRLSCGMFPGKTGFLTCSLSAGALVDNMRGDSEASFGPLIDASEVLVVISASLGKIRLSVKDLGLLEIGDILMTDSKQDEEVLLVAQDVPVSSALLGSHRGRKAIRLTRIIQASDSVDRLESEPT